jgi:serine/threonine protein kinase
MTPSGELLSEVLAKRVLRVGEGLSLLRDIGSFLDNKEKGELGILTPDRILRKEDGKFHVIANENLSFDYRLERILKEVDLKLLPYLPPEVLRGEPLTEAGRIYSLAVILFESLSGDSPFSGDSKEELLANILSGHRQSFTFLTLKAPLMVDATFEEALNTDPTERFQKGRDLVKAFDGVFTPKEVWQSVSLQRSSGEVGILKSDSPKVLKVQSNKSGLWQKALFITLFITLAFISGILLQSKKSGTIYVNPAELLSRTLKDGSSSSKEDIFEKLKEAYQSPNLEVRLEVIKALESLILQDSSSKLFYKFLLEISQKDPETKVRQLAESALKIR